MSKITDYIKEKFTDLSPDNFNALNQYQKNVEHVNKIYDLIYDKISKGNEIFNLRLYCVDSSILNSIVIQMNKNGWDIVVSSDNDTIGEVSIDFKFNKKHKYYE